ncbi:MAG: 3-hydroxyacyl-CoA dehydrogenase NAD-binding domain-containing protein [Myxococcota bacterium]
MSLGRVAVVGAGNMGAGIAQKFATEGAEVVLVDVDRAGVERGLTRIRTMVEEGVSRKVFRPEQGEAILERVTATTDMEEVAGADLVVEAVFEDPGVKREVFEKLDAVCGPGTALATNTSSFRVTDLQEDLPHAYRVLGLHFFYHPAKNRLVEVIAGDQSDPAVVQRVWRLMNALGKTPIRSADAPGFIVNRYFVPYLNEAVRLLEAEHGTPGEIDLVARSVFGTGMGPFALMNATGVPIACHAANTLGEAFGAFYAPARTLERKVSRSEDWEIDEPGDLDRDQRAIIAARLTGAVWLAAGQLVDEGVGTMEDVDLGARVGLRWRLGPFELANRRGVARAEHAVHGLTRRWGLDVPQRFLRQIREDGEGEPFDLSAVVTEVGDDGVGVLTFYRPDQLNALSPKLLKDFEAAWTRLEEDPAVEAVVLAGSGKAFMAGADLKFFADALERRDLETIRTFTERAADLYQRIDSSPKRVVAALDGLSLGGGSELVMCADHVVATDRATLGFPETGLGIYPGLGGTQRTVRRCGRPVTRWLVLTGETVDGPTAHALGLVDVMATRTDVMDVARELALAEDPASLRTGPPTSEPDLARAAARLLADGEVERWLTGQAEPADDEDARRLAKKLSRKAPIALQEAAGLIDLAEPGGDVTGGLRAELERLEVVFGSRDAVAGIQAMVERRRPTFEGR